MTRLGLEEGRGKGPTRREEPDRAEPVALLYSVIVLLTPLTGWHGLVGLYEHHAFLLPVPF